MMRKRDRVNTLLLEVLIAVLFFAIASAAVVRVFTVAWDVTGRSETRAALLAEAQETAERLYAAEDPEAVLTALGFVPTGEPGQWIREAEKTQLTVELRITENGTGIKRTGTVTGAEKRAEQGVTALFSLPCDRYFPKEVPDV